MSFKCGVGSNDIIDTKEALKSAITQAKQKSEIDKIDFIFIYFTIFHKQSDLEEAIKECIPDVPNCGCSGEGIIGKEFSVEGNSPGISVMLFSGKGIKFKHTITEGVEGNSFEVGSKLGLWHKKNDKKSKALILLTDGLKTNYTSLKDGVESNFSFLYKQKIFGGGAGDDFTMKETFQLFNGKVYQNSVVSVSLSGDFSIVHDVTHGISPIGTEHKITKIQDNIIYEIDGRKATDVVDEYRVQGYVDNWGDVTARLAVAFLASDKISKDYDKYLIRYIIQPNDDGSILLSADAKEGESIWITARDIDKLENGIVQMSERLSSELNGKDPKAFFNFDCGGRGNEVMEESRKMRNLKFLQKSLGCSDNWSGFYTYGEYAPVKNTNSFHSYTGVILALY